MAFMITSPDQSNCIYTLHGHKLRLFTLREAQFVTGGIISIQDELLRRENG